MKGTILDFSIPESAGVVSGDDGNRYRFAGADWKATGAMPRAAHGSTSWPPTGSHRRSISTQRRATRGGGSRPLPDGLDDRYRGLYCSSDEKMVLGLCGGLAHKFGVQVSVVRVVVFLVMMFVLWIPYLVGIFLPKVPTRGVPRPV